MINNKTITIKIPKWVKEEDLKKVIEKILTEEYGIVSVKTLREKLGITKLKEKIPINEKEILELRKKEKSRLQI